MDRRLEKLLITICEAGPEDTCAADAYREYTGSLGLEHFVLGKAAFDPDGVFTGLQFIDTLSFDYQQEYEANGYAAADPVLAEALTLSSERSSSIVSYGAYLKYDQSQRDNVRQFFSRISDFGMQTGAAWVSQEKDSDSGYLFCSAVNLGSSREQDALVADVMNNQSGALIAGASILYKVRFGLLKSMKQADAPRLSGREKDVLVEHCEGFRVDRISDNLNLAPSTVRFHANNLKRKLNANTMSQAIANAFRNGLL